ncbi:hypothetical protein DSCA_53150 [Desulfosarcina alkanivorans]|uniref:Uncharacterized protein n=1 Tax=Desulfosarcina alkanivorans TaxID=571177 RepID=A0A5K7YSL5_9BACT|nr:hypothetical protein DSCA_53150 [Desulfosarcina alkanivorans]
MISIATNTFQTFIKTKIRAVIGSSENIKLRKYDSIIQETASQIQTRPTMCIVFGNVFIIYSHT